MAALSKEGKMNSFLSHINFFPCCQKKKKKRRKADITIAKETVDPIIISQCRSDKTSLYCCLMPDDFSHKARLITICFYNGHKRHFTFRLKSTSEIRSGEWNPCICVQESCRPDSCSQVMRIPALQWQRVFGALLKHWFIFGSTAEFSSASTGPRLFQKRSGVWDILRDWSQHIALTLQMNRSPRSPELSAAHFVWELHSSTHFSFFPVSSNF